jgi:ATP-binding protein involved in chromosome partitioning
VTNLSGASDKSNVLEQVLAQRERVATRLAHIKHVVAVMSGKGGVGKSALTANLAAAFEMHGRSVGVLDADIHGASAAAMLGARGQQVVIGTAGARPCIGVAGVQVMSMDLFLDNENSPVNWRHPGGLAADSFVWRSSLEANVLRELLADTDWGALDYLLIDMPPGADRFETVARFVPDLSGTLIITIPSQASHLVVRRAIAAVRQTGVCILGLLENMAGLVGPSGQVAHELFPGGDGATFAAEVDVPYLGMVPFDPRLAHTTDRGRPFVLEHSHTPTGQAILALMQQVEEIVNSKQ